LHRLLLADLPAHNPLSSTRKSARIDLVFSAKSRSGSRRSRRTVQEFRTAVMRWARIFMARPAVTRRTRPMSRPHPCLPDDG
jgi:hypothetical protein